MRVQEIVTQRLHKRYVVVDESGKKSGGQPGHVGNTLRMVEEPDQIIVLHPEQCQRCQHDLAEARMSRLERFQVVDLPKLALAVTEYQAQVKVCPCCQAETRASVPEGMVPASVQYGPQIKALAVYLTVFQLLPVARVSQLLSDLFDTTFSQASALSACQKSSQRVAPVLSQIKAALQTSRVLQSMKLAFGRWASAGGCMWLAPPSSPAIWPIPNEETTPCRP